MAGHSHSSNIKFRKDRVDAKRAKIFAKLSRMITVAVKQGGAFLDGNPKLRLAVDKARVVSMSKDAIERAIKKGAGGGETEQYEEILYEGYGPGGVAVMLEILTDNRNRTAPEIRKVFENCGGNLAATGAVGWMFERRGMFQVDPAAGLGEDRLTDIVLEASADDLVRDGDIFVIYCKAAEFMAVKATLEQAKVPLRTAELVQVPTQRTAVADVAVAQRVVKLLDALDDHDDVQAVHSNEDFPDAVAAALEAQS
ncbi:MAG: YebC/PmpR family DNA-binding transcriptional regulator [Planctomycetes bacterium]|nr:YebC/PmpR family DNA-binding transcriptional regulator [Planctomycetota bacterium]